MTTARWENVPTNVEVGTYSARLTYVCVGCGLSADRDQTVLVVQTNGKRLCSMCLLINPMRSDLGPLPTAESVLAKRTTQDDALDDLRTQLAEARAERDRAQARNRDLEARLQRIRDDADGK